MIKAVIFDMDGVLIDAKEWHYEALNRALDLFGMEISRHDHLVTYDGLPTKKKLEMLSLERGLSAKLHHFINDMKQQYTIELVHSKCKPTFYHEYALAKLKNEGYRIAVCSNSIRKTMELMLQSADLMRYLDFSMSNQDVLYPKPHPEIYVKAIERMGVRSEECLVVEDNENGVRAAISSGAHLFRVYGVQDVTYRNIKKAIESTEV